MSAETFEGFENLFRYMLDDEQYRKFREDFITKRQMYSGPSLL
jgi:hypothetical protein